MIKFTLLTETKYGASPARVLIQKKTIELPEGNHEWNCLVEDIGKFEINFFSKSESDTITDNNGNIIADTEFKILRCWVDGILTEDWFKNAAVYRPNYFKGFLDQFPDSPAEIHAPYQFNFPGTITWSWEGSFWDWYFQQKNKHEIINNLDHDPDRVWKYRGSLDPCHDLVAKIKELIK
jgi:hypothetical protein